MPTPPPDGTAFSYVGQISHKEETFAFQASGSTFTSTHAMTGVFLPFPGDVVLVTVAMNGLVEDAIGDITVTGVTDSQGNTYTFVPGTAFDLQSETWPGPPFAETLQARTFGIWASYIDTHLINTDTITVTYHNGGAGTATDLASMWIADYYTGLLALGSQVLPNPGEYSWLDDASNPLDPTTSPTYMGREIFYQDLHGSKWPVTTPNDEHYYAVIASNVYMSYLPCYSGTTPEPPSTCNFDYVTIISQNRFVSPMGSENDWGTSSPESGVDGALVRANFGVRGVGLVHGNGITTMVEPGMQQVGTPSGLSYKDMSTTYKGGIFVVVPTTQVDPLHHSLDGMAYRLA
jgi:hypothetical protein